MLDKIKQISLKWKVTAVLVLAMALGSGAYFLATTDWDSPETVTAKYFSAIKAGNLQAAYQMTDNSVYHETFKQFSARVNNYGKDMEVKPSKALKQGGTAVVILAYSVTTEFTKLANEGTIDLNWSHRAWRIINP